MSNAIENLYELNNTEGWLPPELCQRINLALVNIDPESIPSQQYPNVCEYIEQAFFAESVQPEQCDSLERLLLQLNMI